jgi:two-component system response regulator ChvI
VCAPDSVTAVEYVEELQPSLGIFEVDLGESSGFELLERIRKNSCMPVIFLSTRATAADKVRGLRLGADDYIAKPFGHQELLARAYAHMRRDSHPTPSNTVDELPVGPLTIDSA